MPLANTINYLTGSKIKLTIADETVFVGIVVGSSKSSTDVRLRNVTAVNDDGSEEPIDGMLTFHQAEIDNFECIDLPQPESSNKLPLPRAPISPPQPAPKQPEPLSAPCEPEPIANDNQPNLSAASVVDAVVDSVPVAAPTSRSPIPPAAVPAEPRPPPPPATDDATNSNSASDTNEYLESISSWTYSFAFRDVSADSSIKRPNEIVVIEELNNEFHKAIGILSGMGVVGCGLDGVHLGRRGKLCWVIMSASDTVFLFDMLALDCRTAFEGGLKYILECSRIIKVFHDCRNSSDILFHQFDIHLENVYDTQVADVMSHKVVSGGRLPKYVRSLATLLKECLSLTETQIAFHQWRRITVGKDTEAWSRRPLSVNHLEACALNVRYLREMRKVTLDNMLSEFTACVDMYLLSPRHDERNQSQSNDCLVPEEFFKFGQCDYSQRREYDPMDGPQGRDRNNSYFYRTHGCNSSVERLTNQYIDGRGDGNWRSHQTQGMGDRRTLPPFVRNDSRSLATRITPNPSVPIAESAKRTSVVATSGNGPAVMLHKPFSEMTTVNSSQGFSNISDYRHVMSKSAVDRLDEERLINDASSDNCVPPMTNRDSTQNSTPLRILPVGFRPR